MKKQQLSSVSNQAEKNKILQLVGFIIGKDRFALDILMVQEIIRSPVITNLPNSPVFIEGVINLRGNIIPVIELRKKLNLPDSKDKKTADSRIIIVNVDNRVTGFIVDSVSEILKIQAGTIEQPPDIVTAGMDSQYIEGVCDIQGDLVILLDFSKILRVDEIKKLKTISKTTGNEGSLKAESQRSKARERLQCPPCINDC